MDSLGLKRMVWKDTTEPVERVWDELGQIGLNKSNLTEMVWNILNLIKMVWDLHFVGIVWDDVDLIGIILDGLD